MLNLVAIVKEKDIVVGCLNFCHPRIYHLASCISSVSLWSFWPCLAATCYSHVSALRPRRRQLQQEVKLSIFAGGCKQGAKHIPYFLQISKGFLRTIHCSRLLQQRSNKMDIEYGTFSQSSREIKWLSKNSVTFFPCVSGICRGLKATCNTLQLHASKWHAAIAAELKVDSASKICTRITTPVDNTLLWQCMRSGTPLQPATLWPHPSLSDAMSGGYDEPVTQEETTDSFWEVRWWIKLFWELMPSSGISQVRF